MLTNKQIGNKLGIAILGLTSYAGEQIIPALSQTQKGYLAGLVCDDRGKAVQWALRHNIPETNIFFGAPPPDIKMAEEELTQKKIRTLFLIYNTYNQLPRIRGCRVLELRKTHSKEAALAIGNFVNNSRRLKTNIAITCSGGVELSPSIAIACALAQGHTKEQLWLTLQRPYYGHTIVNLEWCFTRAEALIKTAQESAALARRQKKVRWHLGITRKRTRGRKK